MKNMYKKNVVVVFAIIFSVHAYAQVNFTIQDYSYGGSRTDGANSIIKAGNGNYVIAGNTQSFDGQVTGFHHDPDFWIIKINSNGNLIWQKDIGGDKDDVPFDVVQSADGGFVAAGETGSVDGDITFNHGGLDFFVVKLNANGKIVWKKTYGGISNDDAHSIVALPDGSFLVAGDTKSNNGDVSNNHGATDMWVIKLDANGNLKWQKTYGNIFDDELSEIELTKDGGFILTGRTKGLDGDLNAYDGTTNFAVIKVDKRGNVQWQKEYGGSDFDEAHSIYQTADGGYVVGGFAASHDGQVTGNHGFNDIWIVRIDSVGNVKWQKSLGGSKDDRSFDVIPATDGGIIVSGAVASNNGDIHGNHDTLGYGDMWFAKLNNNGKLLYSRCLGGFYTESASSVIPAYNEGYMLAGHANSFAGDGDVSNFLGGGDYWVVHIIASTTFDVAENSIKKDVLKLSPNPSNGNFIINLPSSFTKNKTIIVTNNSGSEVLRMNADSKTQINISLNNIINGIYTVSVLYDDKIIKQPLIIQL